MKALPLLQIITITEPPQTRAKFWMNLQPGDSVQITFSPSYYNGQASLLNLQTGEKSSPYWGNLMRTLDKIAYTCEYSEKKV